MCDPTPFDITTNTTREVFATDHSSTATSITINPWYNGDGVSLMIHGKDLSLQLSGSMTWETVDLLIAALMQARRV